MYIIITQNINHLTQDFLLERGGDTQNWEAMVRFFSHLIRQNVRRCVPSIRGQYLPRQYQPILHMRSLHDEVPSEDLDRDSHEDPYAQHSNNNPLLKEAPQGPLVEDTDIPIFFRTKTQSSFDNGKIRFLSEFVPNRLLILLIQLSDFQHLHHQCTMSLTR